MLLQQLFVIKENAFQSSLFRFTVYEQCGKCKDTNRVVNYCRLSFNSVARVSSLEKNVYERDCFYEKMLLIQMNSCGDGGDGGCACVYSK